MPYTSASWRRASTERGSSERASRALVSARASSASIAPLERAAAHPATSARDATSPHRPDISYQDALASFDAPTPEHEEPEDQVIAELMERTAPGLAAMTGPRFFGWVIGATEPAGVAADWLVSAWGQNAGNALATPAASAGGEVAGRWRVG